MRQTKRKPGAATGIVAATLAFMLLFPWTFAASGYARSLLPARSRAADLTMIAIAFVLAAVVPYCAGLRVYTWIVNRGRRNAGEEPLTRGRRTAILPFIVLLALWLPAAMVGDRVTDSLMPPIRSMLGTGSKSAALAALLLMGLITLPLAFVPPVLLYHCLLTRQQTTCAPPSGL